MIALSQRNFSMVVAQEFLPDFFPEKKLILSRIFLIIIKIS